MPAYDPAKHVRALVRRIKKNLKAQKKGRAAKLFRNGRTKYWRSLAERTKDPKKRAEYQKRAQESSELGAKIVKRQRRFFKRRKKLQKALKRARRRLAAARRKASGRQWGGCRAITNQIIEIVGDRAPVTSRKRVETFGNPGSDHHVSQRDADAVDFGIENAYDLAREIAAKLGASGEWSGDYDSFTVNHKGKTFRVQLIAGTHGTGPHLHCGVRRT